MTRKVMLTCAVTGAGSTTRRHPGVPVTPAQIAAACIEAAKAGATAVHIHVRDPATGEGGRDPAHFREVVTRIRDSATDVVLNLTCGMGGRLVLDDEDPSVMIAGTDMAKPLARMEHVRELLPEICTIDCGSMNFGREVAINRVGDLERMTRFAQQLGVKPELEVFDYGQIGIARHLIDSALVDSPPLFQLCLGIAGGTPATTEALLALRAALPPGAHWGAFGISRAEFPMVAQTAILGGNVRVGLEDNLYLEAGRLATNGELVEKALEILRLLDVAVMTPSEARQAFGLRQHHR